MRTLTDRQAYQRSFVARHRLSARFPDQTTTNMPIYEYSCSQCNEHFEKVIRISQMEEPLAEACPSCDVSGFIVQEPTSFSLGDPISFGHKRPDAGFGEVLSKIKQAHPRHNMSNSKFAQTRSV